MVPGSVCVIGPITVVASVVEAAETIAVVFRTEGFVMTVVCGVVAVSTLNVVSGLVDVTTGNEVVVDKVGTVVTSGVTVVV